MMRCLGITTQLWTSHVRSGMLAWKLSTPEGKAACWGMTACANRQKQTLAFKIQIYPMGGFMQCCLIFYFLLQSMMLLQIIGSKMSWLYFHTFELFTVLASDDGTEVFAGSLEAPGIAKSQIAARREDFFLWTGTTVLLISSAFVYNSYPRAIPWAAGSLSEIYMCMAPSGAITQLQRNSCLWIWRGSMKEGWAGRLELCKAHGVPEKCCSKLRLLD